MSQRSGYEPGVPCWVGLSSTDVEASVRFYGEVFGWRAEMTDDPRYGRFAYRGRKVAGVGPVVVEGGTPAWDTYVATEDAAATADRVKNSGGTVLMDPARISDAGSTAVFQGPDGAFVSVWQADGHHGAELVDEPVSFCWNQLVTRDVAAAERFYRAVFDWTPQLQELDGVDYVEWQVGGKGIAGMMEMAPGYPPETPSHWMVYFAVAELDTTVATARRLGAHVLIDSMDAPPGRFGVLVDPQGAALSVIQLHEIE
ncbi:VOC family protein [Nonomuraea cavernae]|uniref:Hydrolase n=1 Tax=Nonomuraea cavernae TaxID=2045107 RepID=A0A917Z618_9ACTN|nr:VOC family protein [Nonomuraea cavernae]MCA2189108.1 VOC family protein [Nonomuraea cavernae]GGO76187.1 hydrolase [Nonomuraea cavernae]